MRMQVGLAAIAVSFVLAAPAFADCKGDIKNLTPHISGGTLADRELKAASDFQHQGREADCKTHIQRAEQAQTELNRRAASGSSSPGLGGAVNQLLNSLGGAGRSN